MSASAPHTLIPQGLVLPGEVLSASTIIASIMGWLPPLAALMGIIWYCVLLYDRFWRVKPQT